MNGARTDGRHGLASAAAVMALAYECRDCGCRFPGTELYVWDQQTQGGRARRLLSVDGRDPVDQDDLRHICDSTDIEVVA
jgi:hypothetical protein